MDLVPQLGSPFKVLLADGLLLFQLQRVQLPQIGEPALFLMAHEVVLLLLLDLLHRCRADGGHGVKEIVEGALQHPVHPAQQGRHGAEEIAEEIIIAEEAVHHGRPPGKELLGVAQLFRTGLTEVMLLGSAVDAAAIYKADFILAAIFAFHNWFLP